MSLPMRINGVAKSATTVGGGSVEPIFLRACVNPGDDETAVQNLIANISCQHANAGTSVVIDLTGAVTDRVQVLVFGHSVDVSNNLYAVGGTDQNARDCLITLDPIGGTATRVIVSLSPSVNDTATLNIEIVE